MSERLAVVIGAATPPGRLHAAATLLGGLARDAHRAEVKMVDLSEIELETADGRPLLANDEATRDAVACIAGAGGVVIASPVYRASIPGVLKNLLDLVPVEALQDKPVGILAMGASAHHFLGVDRHLRDILSWFGALVAPTSVYLTGADFVDGWPTDAARTELDALVGTVVTLAERLGGAPMGPAPLASRAW